MYRLLLVVTLLVFSTGFGSSVYAQSTAQMAGTYPTLPTDEGIVLSFQDVEGYTYMELVNGAKRFWIAAPTTQVKNGDHIRFIESMRMNNFTSKMLNQTFDTLIFVSSTKIAVKP